MRRLVAAVAGIAVSVVFGWLAIRGLNFHEVRSAIGAREPGLDPGRRRASRSSASRCAPSAGARSSRASRGRGAVPTFWASQIGLLANNVLPRARRRARARALALPRVGPAAHGRARDGRRRARLRPRRDRRAAARGRPAAAGRRRRRGASRCSPSRILAVSALVVVGARHRARAPRRRRPPHAPARAALARRRADRLAAHRPRGAARPRARRRGAALDAGLVARARVRRLVRAAGLRPAPALARRALPARRRHVRAGGARERGLGRACSSSPRARRSWPTACRPRSRSRPGLVLHAVSALPFIALGAVGMARLGVSGRGAGPRRRGQPDLRGLRRR